MKFDLKKPCKDCPFRSDRELNHGWLGKNRAIEIAKSLDDYAFPCHKTTQQGVKIYNKKEQHCFGALVVLQNEGVFFANKMMRIAVLYGFIEQEAVFESDSIVKNRQQFIEMHT